MAEVAIDNTCSVASGADRARRRADLAATRPVARLLAGAGGCVAHQIPAPLPRAPPQRRRQVPGDGRRGRGHRCQRQLQAPGSWPTRLVAEPVNLADPAPEPPAGNFSMGEGASTTPSSSRSLDLDA